MSDPTAPFDDGTVPVDADLVPDETTNPPLPDGGPGQHHPDLPPKEKPTQDEPLLT